MSEEDSFYICNSFEILANRDGTQVTQDQQSISTSKQNNLKT